VSPLFIAALLLVAWEAAVRRGPFGGLRFKLPRVPARFVMPAAIVLLVAFAAQLGLLDYQASHDGWRPAWFSAAPYHLNADVLGVGPAHRLISFAALFLSLLQTIALIALIAGASEAPPKSIARRLPFFTAAGLALLALASPAVSSSDVFGYVGLGMMGSEAYVRHAGFFHGEYARLFDAFPVRPTIYGPLWVGINALVVMLGSTFAAKVLALRIFGVVLIAAMFVLARALGAGRATQWAIALNPMLWFQFVTNAHNDAMAIVVMLGAVLAVARRRPWIAVALIAAAGLIKFPFLIIGMIVFVRGSTRSAAIAYGAAAVALCIALSAAFGGHPYLDALLATARHGSSFWRPEISIAKAIVAVVALGATAAMLLSGRISGFTGWLYTGLAPVLFPWYLAWMVVYCAAIGAGVLETLLALPVLATLADGVFALDDISLLIALAVSVFVVLAARRRRSGLLLPA